MESYSRREYLRTVVSQRRDADAPLPLRSTAVAELHTLSQGKARPPVGTELAASSVPAQRGAAHDFVAAATAGSSIAVLRTSDLSITGMMKCSGGAASALCVCSARRDADSTVLAVARDSRVQMRDVRTVGKVAGKIEIPHESILAMDGEKGTIVCGCESGKVLQFDLRQTKVPLYTFEDAHGEPVTAVRVHCGDRYVLATGAEDGLVCLWGSAKPEWREDDDLEVICNVEQPIAWIELDDSHLLVSSYTQEASLYNWEEGGDLVSRARLTKPSADGLVDESNVTLSRFLVGGCLVRNTDASTTNAFLFGAARNGSLYTHQLDDNQWKTLHCGQQHSEPVRHCIRKRDLFLSIGEDGRVVQWDIPDILAE